MIHLKPVTEENFLDVFALQRKPEQERFVSHPIRSLAQAYVYRSQCQPFAICAGNAVVGYVMVIYDYDIPEYDIWHMMVDAAHQGKGYGAAALAEVLAYIRTKPFDPTNRVTLTCHRENAAALKLYHRMGFAETGAADGDEIELSLLLS